MESHQQQNRGLDFSLSGGLQDNSPILVESVQPGWNPDALAIKLHIVNGVVRNLMHI